MVESESGVGSYEAGHNQVVGFRRLRSFWAKPAIDSVDMFSNVQNVENIIARITYGGLKILRFCCVYYFRMGGALCELAPQ